MSQRSINPVAMEVKNLKLKIDKLMGSKVQEDEEFIETMNFVSTMINNGNISERRLKHSLQDRELRMNRQFLENFEKMNNSVQDYVGKIETMSGICTELTNRIQTNKEKTRDLLTKTAALQAEKKQLQTERTYIDDFFSKYSLTQNEELVLSTAVNELKQTGVINISEPFFKVLKKLHVIKHNVDAALAVDTESTALSEMKQCIEEKTQTAFDILQKFGQRECRQLNVEFLEVKPILQMAIDAIHIKKDLFEQVMKEYNQARRMCVLKAFMDALTKGKGSTKPIEFLSNEPLRYINDMLAWLHQAFEQETELLQTLLKNCPIEIISPTIKDTLNNISEQLINPLKLRIEQTLTRETNAVVLYRLSSLLLYYKRHFEQALKSQSNLVGALGSLNEFSSNMFYSVVSSTVQRILNNMGVPDYDLLPVNAINQTLLLLRDILEGQNDGAFTAIVDKKETYAKIFSHVLDPLNQSVQLTCSNIHNPLDVAVYMLNCLNAIRTVVIMYQYTDTKLEMIKAQIEANEDVLVGEQASSILIKCNMLDIYTKCVAHQPNQGPLSQISGLDEERITQSLALFDNFLQKPESYQAHQIIKISSARSRETVQKRTFEHVVTAYRIIHDKLVNHSNLYKSLSPKPVEEVNQILLPPQ